MLALLPLVALVACTSSSDDTDDTNNGACGAVSTHNLTVNGVVETTSGGAITISDSVVLGANVIIDST